MKSLLLSFLLFMSLGSYASKTDSLFHRHQVSFSVTNGVSVVPYNYGIPFGYSNYPYFPYNNMTYNPYGIPPNFYLSYLPNYILHLKLEYSVGLSKLIRIEAGAGYLIQGLTIKYYGNPGIAYYTSTAYCYIGMLAIPLHIKFTKALRKGFFTCTFGPNVTFPFHEFYTTTDVQENGIKQPSQSGHQRFSSITDNASLGLDLKMGYQKQLNKHLSVNFGPIIYVMQIDWVNYRKMDADQQVPRLPFESYIGLDVAFNFEVGKKK